LVAADYSGRVSSVPHIRAVRIGIGLLASIFLGHVASAADTSANVAPTEAPITHWSDIKGDTYEQRVQFLDGARRLLVRLDGEIAPLNARRAAMITDTAEWDFSMKDVNSCRELLRDRISQMDQATTPETWAHAKDQLELAWHSAELAVDKMKSTVTSG
jgi:hypothetical protein